MDSRARVGVGVGVVAMLLMFGALALLIDRAHEGSRRALEERFDLRASLAASFGQSYVSSLVEAERRHAEERLGAASVHASAFAAVVESFEFEAAVLLDSTGRVIHVWPRSRTLVGVRLSDRYAHLRAALSGRVGISPVVPSAVRQTRIVAFATPFRTPHGRRVFSGAFAVARTPFAQYLRTALPLGGSELYVVDDGGAIVVASSARRAATLAERDRALAGAAARATRGSYDGRDGRSYFSTASIDGTPWRVVAAVPEHELFAPVSGATARLPWLLFAAFALAALAVVALLVRVRRDRCRLAEANTALSAHNDELRELDRMKDDFVASVSHEFRTPLTSVRGYLELVLEGDAGELNEEQRNFLSVVNRNAERLLRVVDDLLFVARVDAGSLSLDLRVVDVADVATQAVDAARPAAEAKGVALSVAAAGSACITGDESRLSQVMDNLISNAVKFTPPGGRVEVRTALVEDHAILEVRDTGMGIAEDEQAWLFSRFFRTGAATRESIPGTGLGLAITKAIVEAHGGTISVESKVGAGTTFLVELPRADVREPAGAAA